MKQEFEELMNGLKKTVADYKYYTDFNKVEKNVKSHIRELNLLNSLIGSDNIEKEFLELINEYPKVIKVLPILLAVRKSQISVIDNKEMTIKFDGSESEDVYCKFMNETGLFDLVKEKKIKSFVDYVIGVEVGLDSNARKNRTGTTMENIVESYIKQVDNITYHKEMKKKEVADKFNINLDLLISGDEKSEKSAEKKFDFVVKTEEKLYLIETNFYSSGGSKLNETSRSFKSLAQDIEKLDNVEFVWITDGVGWKTAKNNLKETYEVMEHLYTLSDLENGILGNLFN